MELDQIFNGDSRVEKIIELTERLERIDKACNKIRYDENLFTEVPELVKTLGAAKDAVIAELKTL